MNAWAWSSGGLIHNHCYRSSVCNTSTALNVILTHLPAIIKRRTVYSVCGGSGGGGEVCLYGHENMIGSEELNKLSAYKLTASAAVKP
jgi:hypothetical protein